MPPLRARDGTPAVREEPRRGGRHRLRVAAGARQAGARQAERETAEHSDRSRRDRDEGPCQGSGRPTSRLSRVREVAGSSREARGRPRERWRCPRRLGPSAFIREEDRRGRARRGQRGPLGPRLGLDPLIGGGRYRSGITTENVESPNVTWSPGRSTAPFPGTLLLLTKVPFLEALSKMKRLPCS